MDKCKYEANGRCYNMKLIREAKIVGSTLLRKGLKLKCSTCNERDNNAKIQ